MKRVHLTLQGKGGIGKSLVASLVAQYLRSKGEAAIIIDADPVTPTLSGYTLDAQRLELMDGLVLVENKYDPLFARAIEEDSSFVIDNGPSSFFILSNYIVENDVINMISNRGKEVIFHTVINGGQALLDTVSEFFKLTMLFPEPARFVIWLNPFLGPIEVDGKSFTEFKAYKKNAHRVAGIVDLPAFQNQIYRDFGDMVQNQLTFDEANTSSSFGVVAKNRLHRVKEGIYQQIEAIV